MIINEKGLTAALKKAYKAGGYVMVNSETQIILYTEDWYVRASWAKFPAKALGTIVEHMESLPAEAGALGITKGEPPQYILEDIVGNEVAFWEETGETPNLAAAAPMTFHGVRIFQISEGGACYGISATQMGIVESDVIEKNTARIQESGRMIWEAEEERVAVRAVRPSTYMEDSYAKAVWSSLEKIDLLEEKRP